MALHPLDPLSPDEFGQTAAALRRDHGVTAAWRFVSIELMEPSKQVVRAFKPGDPSAGKRSPCCGTERTAGPTRRGSI